MKYLTRPAERPARILSDDPIETPPVFKTSDPKEAVKEVIRRAGGGDSVDIGIAPGVSLNPLGTAEDQDPSLTGRFGVGGGELEFGVKKDQGFVGFRKEFDEGGSVKASSVVAEGLDSLRLARPLLYETGFGAAVAPFDFVEGRPMSEILLDVPTLGIAGQSLRAEKLRQKVGPEVFDKIQEQRAAKSEGVGGIESSMFEDLNVDEAPLEQAIQERADREAKVAKTRKIQDVSESDIMGVERAVKENKTQKTKRDESLNVDDTELL